MENTIDILAYAGEVNTAGYEAVCEQLKKKKSNRAVLILSTPGGDPHAGFRIARALQHTYESFDALVPRYCKSAGTLLVIGAKNLYLDDRSELGPLDIQVRKSDEIVGRNSGLDYIQAVNNLQVQTMNAFKAYVTQLVGGTGLSTKVAADISVRLTTGTFEPIFAQIDPNRLAEMQRATEIAFEYGRRLDESSDNLLDNGLVRLVTGYRSHGFVIDRKEARSVFKNVHKPAGELAKISAQVGEELERHVNSSKAVVFELLTIPTGATHEATPNAGSSAESPESGGPAVSGDSAIDHAPDTAAAVQESLDGQSGIAA